MLDKEKIPIESLAFNKGFKAGEEGIKLSVFNILHGEKEVLQDALKGVKDSPYYNDKPSEVRARIVGIDFITEVFKEML